MARIGILITGGGTAGHIYPLLAVAKKLPPETDVRYFGNPGDFAADLEENNIRVTRIISSKLRRYASIKNILDFFKFFLGLFEALGKVFLFMPNVVFSKGGPGALPVVLAARFYRIPVVIHESDSIPGRTNAISARLARIIELGFEKSREYLPRTKAKVNVVGNPIRENITAVQDKNSARELFGLSPNMPVILFLGGSQGAAPINDFIFGNAERLLNKFQIIHQVGKNNFGEYKNSYDFISKDFSDALKKRYRFYPYLGANIGDALDAADIVVSRAGSSIFEIAAKGKPAILVPLSPKIAGVHQIRNAYIYSDAGAAIVIEEANLLISVFLTQVTRILDSPELTKKMTVAARTFAKPDAAEKIARDIMSLINH